MTLLSIDTILQKHGYKKDFHVARPELLELAEEIEKMTTVDEVARMAADTPNRVMRILGFDYAESPEILIVSEWCQQRVLQIRALEN